MFELWFRSQGELHDVFPRRTCNRKRQCKPAYFGHVTWTACTSCLFFFFLVFLVRALCRVNLKERLYKIDLLL